MRTALLGILLFSGFVFGQAPATTQISAVLIDQTLDAMERAGRDLRNFTANVTLTETDNQTGDETARLGQVWYEKKPDGSARIRVLFTVRRQGERNLEQRIEYLLDGDWLIDRDYQKRIEVRRQVLRPGEKINLLKLGEGPFPLPIGQDKKDVYAQFSVEAPQGLIELPGTVHLQLTPRPATRFERRFSAIDVWTDPQSGMPRRIATLDKNQTTTRTTDLSDVILNKGTKETDFALPPIDPNTWQRHEEPFTD